MPVVFTYQHCIGCHFLRRLQYVVRDSDILRKTARKNTWWEGSLGEVSRGSATLTGRRQESWDGQVTPSSAYIDISRTHPEMDGYLRLTHDCIPRTMRPTPRPEIGFPLPHYVWPPTTSVTFPPSNTLQRTRTSLEARAAGEHCQLGAWHQESHDCARSNKHTLTYTSII